MDSYIYLSGLTFYAYNELATMTLTKISAVTQSVANTAKRVVVIVGSAIVFNESISGLKAIGCAICIGGIYSLIYVIHMCVNVCVCKCVYLYMCMSLNIWIYFWVKGYWSCHLYRRYVFINICNTYVYKYVCKCMCM
jgi:hypothetical protein